jgi:hypothetical protein
MIAKVYFVTFGNYTVGAALFIADLILLAFANYALKKLDNFTTGDIGEREIKRVLDQLPNGYFYLSDFMNGRKTNIDSVVIGPTGVWSIEVKNYKKKEIKLDKYLLEDIEQTKLEAKPLQDLLTIPVTSVLVFANPKTKIHFGMVPQYGVYVIGKSWLMELITKTSKTVLNPQQCLQIKEQLKNYTSIVN